MINFVLGLLCLVAAMFSTTAVAQEWPSRPIRFVVPWQAGGINDALARLYNDKVAAALGQPFVHEFKAGAAGRIGMGEVARAAPNGYTLVLGNSGPLTIHPNLYAKLPYDPDKSFAPVAMYALSPLVLVVRAESPVQTFDDLRKQAAAAPVKIASGGVASPHHLSLELMKKHGFQVIPVHFKGPGEVLPVLMGGGIDGYFEALGTLMGQIQDGRLRALAVTSDAPAPQLPNVRPLAELGYPGLSVYSFYSVLAPAGTPEPIVKRLAAEYDKAARTPEVQEFLSAQGLIAKPMTPEQMSKFFAEQRARWKQVIEEQNIKVE